MKNNILISVILALVVALGIVVIGSDEAVAQTGLLELLDSAELQTGARMTSVCLEGHVFVGSMAGGVIQAYQQEGNNSVPMKCE